MKKLIFDASSLIASAQFAVANRLIIQHVLAYAEVVIPEGVKGAGAAIRVPGCSGLGQVGKRWSYQSGGCAIR